MDETHQPLCISDGEGANMDPVTEHMSVSSWVGEFVSSYEVNVSVREKKRSRDRMSAHKPYYSFATIKVNKNYQDFKTIMTFKGTTILKLLKHLMISWL